MSERHFLIETNFINQTTRQRKDILIDETFFCYVYTISEAVDLIVRILHSSAGLFLFLILLFVSLSLSLFLCCGGAKAFFPLFIYWPSPVHRLELIDLPLLQAVGQRLQDPTFAREHTAHDLASLPGARQSIDAYIHYPLV